jgi:hypothetical protein
MKNKYGLIIMLLVFQLVQTTVHNSGILPYALGPDGRLKVLLRKDCHKYWGDFSGFNVHPSRFQAIKVFTHQTSAYFGIFAQEHGLEMKTYSPGDASYNYINKRITHVLKTNDAKEYLLFLAYVDYISPVEFKRYLNNCSQMLDYAWVDAQKLLCDAQRFSREHAFYDNKQLKYQLVDMLKLLDLASFFINE